MIKILVVEDDAGLNMTVCAFLRKNGYDVTGCMHANDAYNAMYNTLFDLIISDVMMPQIDGFEFAETVRKINQTIPIIFMTARDDFTSKQKGFAAGIDDYLVKPVDLDELLLRISAILRRAKISQSKKLTVGSLTLDALPHFTSVRRRRRRSDRRRSWSVRRRLRRRFRRNQCGSLRYVCG